MENEKKEDLLCKALDALIEIKEDANDLFTQDMQRAIDSINSKRYDLQTNT